MTTKALAYLGKSGDPNGKIELSLTSSPDKIHKTGKNENSSLSALLEQQRSKSSPGRCNMEHVLGTLLQRVKEDLSPRETLMSFKRAVPARPVNIYILTDAIWEGREIHCGVDGPIRSLTTFMKKQGLDRTFVAL